MSKEYEHAALYKRYNDIHHEIFGEAEYDIPLDGVDKLIERHLRNFRYACLLIHSAQSGNQDSINVYLDALDDLDIPDTALNYVKTKLLHDPY